MLGMSYYNQNDYQTAAQTFITNITMCIRVVRLPNWHVFMPVKALYPGYAGTPFGPVRYISMQSSNYRCFWSIFRTVQRKHEAQNMIFALQDKLVMKELSILLSSIIIWAIT